MTVIVLVGYRQLLVLSGGDHFLLIDLLMSVVHNKSIYYGDNLSTNKISVKISKLLVSPQGE